MKTIINRPTPYNGDNIGNSFTVESTNNIPKSDKPKDVIAWCKREIKAYEKLIKLMEKQIILEKSLPKPSKNKNTCKLCGISIPIVWKYCDEPKCNLKRKAIKYENTKAKNSKANSKNDKSKNKRN